MDFEYDDKTKFAVEKLSGLLDGKIRSAFAMTEPEVGSRAEPCALSPSSQD